MDATGDSANALNLSPEEKRVFGQLFRQADSENIGVVTGEVAVKFFEKTRLDPHVLGEIWQIADTENRGLLTPAGFGKVLRLIGHCQAGRTPTPELAFRPGPLPKFDGGAPGSVIQPPPGPPPSAMQPQMSGQGVRVPPLTPDKVNQYSALFEKSGGAHNGLLAGEQARAIFERAGLPIEILGRIWSLADIEGRGALNVTEFIIAMHLLASLKAKTMTGLPAMLPPGLYEAASRRAPARQLTGQTTGGMGPIPRQMTGVGRGASPLGGSAYGIPPQLTGQVTGGWAISPQDKARFDTLFAGLDKANRGVITGEEAVPFFTESKLPEDVLAQIWDLADINSEGHLNSDEFAVAMYLIRQQRGKPTGRDSLPPTLPPNLIPPSMRNQMRPPTQPTAPDFDTVAPSMQKSAVDDLFGLDALSSPTLPAAAPAQLSMATGGSSSAFGAPSDPFGNSRSPAAAISPVPTGSPQQSNFKPFMPSSSFGQSLGYQATGNSNASAPQNRSTPPQQQTSAVEDLLGDNDPAVSAKLTNETAELANLSNQISSLSTQMQEVQGQRSATQNEVTQSSAQKRQFEERLASLRSLYEKEVKDVRGLEESLRASRNEVQKLQKEMAMLDGAYQDLQNQRQQVTTQLQADQQENANLKERMKVVNAEVAQMKPQLEKLRLEARQQKGLVAINKKQLATNEAEREKVKTEIGDLTKSNQENARAIAEANSRVQSPAPAPVASPAPSTNNPFFRRQQSIDATPATTSPYSQPTGGDRSFDNIFGPAIVAPEKPEKVPSEPSEAIPAFPFPVREGSEQNATAPESGNNEPPPPPESRQISSSFLPFPHPQRTDSLGSSKQVSAPTSRFGGEGSNGIDTPTATSTPTASSVGASADVARGASPALDRNMTASPAASEALSTANGSIPGAFPDDSAAPTPSGEPTLNVAMDTFPALEKEDRTPTATKNDFDAAFADFRTGPGKAQERQNTGGSSASAAPKDFTSEFPPMAELENMDDSDSPSEGGGFEDDFTAASPGHTRKASSGVVPSAVHPGGDPPAENAQVPPPSYDKSLGSASPPSDVRQFDGLLPTREDPTTTTNPTDDIFGGPLTTSQSPFGQSPFASSGPTATTTQVPQPPAKVPFDEFDDEFDGLEDAQEGEADDIGDISALEHSTMDDFNPVFDSPSVTSKTSNHGANDSGVFGHDGSFNNAFADFNASQGSQANHPSTSTSTAPPPTQDNHDWDDIFSSFEKTPTESTAPTNGNGNGLGNGNGMEELASPSTLEPSDRPQLGRALTEAGEHDDPILKNLTGMGYARKDALAALEKYDYNLERAANFLASQS